MSAAAKLGFWNTHGGVDHVYSLMLGRSISIRKLEISWPLILLLRRHSLTVLQQKSYLKYDSPSAHQALKDMQADTVCGLLLTLSFAFNKNFWSSPFLVFFRANADTNSVAGSP